MRPGIRHKILLATLLPSCVSLLLFYLLIIGSTETMLRHNLERQLRQLTAKSSAGIQDLVAHSERTVLAIAATPDLKEFLEARSATDQRRRNAAFSRLERSFLDFQRLDPTIQAIRFVDADGNVLVKVREGEIVRRIAASRPESPPAAIHSLRGRDFFTEALGLGRGKVRISNMERGKVEGETKWCPAMIRFSTPVFTESGRLAGLVVTNIWAETTGKTVNSLISAEEGSAFLVERNQKRAERHGIYLFHQDTACEFGNQTGTEIKAFRDFPDSITASWMRDDEGVQIDPRTGNMLAHRFYSPFGEKDRGWVVVVNARKSFLLTPLRTTRMQITLLGAISLLISIAAAIFFTRSLTRPIQTIVAGVGSLKQDLSSRISLRSTDELGTLATEINRMAETIQRNIEERLGVEERICNTEKLAAVGEMAAGLAHEINTPLGNINALAALARKELDAPAPDLVSVARDLEDIGSQTARCSGIIGGLLSFARRRNPEIINCEASAIIAEALSLVGIKAGKKGVALSFAPPPAPLPVKVDRPQILQVFVNILLNAIDAAPPESGLVSVAAGIEGASVRIMCIDNGAGIAPELREKIFAPFFTTKDVGEGTGLGLSVSYGIVQSHGGEIMVASEQGKGTTFTVVLPTGGKA